MVIKNREGGESQDKSRQMCVLQKFSIPFISCLRIPIILNCIIHYFLINNCNINYFNQHNFKAASALHKHSCNKYIFVHYGNDFKAVDRCLTVMKMISQYNKKYLVPRIMQNVISYVAKWFTE